MSWGSRTDKSGALLAHLWVFGFFCGWCYVFFVYLVMIKETYQSLTLFFFPPPLQHFLPCFLEYIEHCFSDTDALAKDEAMAILAKLILVKAEPPTIGSMAFEKYPLVFTESSVRWGFWSLANTRCVCMAAGLKAAQSYIKVAPQYLLELCKWQSCWQIRKPSDTVGSVFFFLRLFQKRYCSGKIITDIKRLVSGVVGVRWGFVTPRCTLLPWAVNLCSECCCPGSYHYSPPASAPSFLPVYIHLVQELSWQQYYSFTIEHSWVPKGMQLIQIQHCAGTAWLF